MESNAGAVSGERSEARVRGVGLRNSKGSGWVAHLSKR